MTNRLEKLNQNVLTCGIMIGTRPSSSPEEHWEKVSGFSFISDIVFAIHKIQPVLGDMWETSNGWSSRSWFNHPFMCILSAYLKEFLPVEEQKTQGFQIESLRHSFPRPSLGSEDLDLSPASFPVNNLQEIVRMRVYVLLEKLSLSREALWDTNRQTCKMCSEPQIYSVLPKQISKWYEICFRKCTPLHLQNITGWRENSALAFALSWGGRHRWGRFICSASRARSCSWPSKMLLWIARVSQVFSNRKVELEQRAGTRQTSSVKDYPTCHLGANIPINPSNSISPRET